MSGRASAGGTVRKKRASPKPAKRTQPKKTKKAKRKKLAVETRAALGSGWRPASFDARDLRFAEAVPAVREVLPPAAALPHPHPVRDQRQVPCCVSIAVATCMEAIDALHGPAVQLSVLFNYFVARPDPGVPATLELRDGLNAATRAGICEFALHPAPFSEAGMRQRPSAAAVADARRRCIVGASGTMRRPCYRRLPADPMEWRRALAMSMPLAIGIWVTPAYHAMNAQRPVHGPVEGATSEGHAVTVLGYDDARRVFTVKDSRGQGFAAQGYWYLPYALLSEGVVHDAWAVERLTYD